MNRNPKQSEVAQAGCCSGAGRVEEFAPSPRCAARRGKGEVEGAKNADAGSMCYELKFDVEL